jgi:hypothetical protein
MLHLLSAVSLVGRAANLRGMVRAAVARVVLASIGLVFLAAAAGFGLFAVYIALVPRLGLIGAACAIGVALLVVGLILLLVAQRPPESLSASLERRLSPDLKAQYERAARALGTGSPLTNPIVVLAGAALLAGYFMGRRRPRRD